MAATRRRNEAAEGVITVGSDAFSRGDAIPREFTCQGADASLPFTVGGVPTDARGIAIVLDDPDAPGGTFTHWTAWNVPRERTAFAKGADLQAMGAREGTNDFGRTGYGGPCPPSGEEHRYFLKVYALREPVDFRNGASPDAVHAALEGNVLARGELMGTYRKS